MWAGIADDIATHYRQDGLDGQRHASTALLSGKRLLYPNNNNNNNNKSGGLKTVEMECNYHDLFLKLICGIHVESQSKRLLIDINVTVHIRSCSR